MSDDTDDTDDTDDKIPPERPRPANSNGNGNLGNGNGRRHGPGKSHRARGGEGAALVLVHGKPDHHHHGHPRSWEELADDALFMRDVVQLLIEGYSYSAIAEYYEMDRNTLLKISRRIPAFINEETRALTVNWQAFEFMRLESMSRRLLPFIMDTEDAEGDDSPPNPKHIMAYRSLVMSKLAVLTLNRHDDYQDPDENSADQKATSVGRYMELADKLIAGVKKAGYGSGRAPEDDDLADELEDMNARADNSGTIEDAVVLDERGPATEEELDSEPGEWRDGKFYPTARPMQGDVH